MQITKQLLCFSILIILGSCTNPIPEPDAPIDLYDTVQYRQVDGIDPQLLSLDIYFNNRIDTLKPVLIYVHGGAWCIGDKANQIENKENLCRDLNYLLVSVNYRLSPFPYELDNPDRVMYPVHNRDLAAAVKWVHEQIASYGGDPDKIVLLGHSAGAHLAALSGTNKDFFEEQHLDPACIKGIASIDTEGYNVLENVQDSTNFYINAFGTQVDSLTQASPILNIEESENYPDFFIAKRGDSVRLAAADAFIQALEDADVSVVQVNGSIYTHQEINEAIGQSGETLISDPLKAFLQNCFK